MPHSKLRKWLRLGSVVILVAGLFGALAIYRYAEDIPDASLGYAIIDGKVYPLSTRDSRAYRRTLEQFGGKAALLFDDFSRWFLELWQGKTLGITVGCISVMLSAGIYLLSEYMAGPEPGSRELNQTDQRS